jgi:multidrug efflux pump
MSSADVTSQIGMYLSGGYVTRFDNKGKTYRVVPMLRNDLRGNPDELLNLPISLPNGETIPLAAIAVLKRQAAPRVLSSFQLKNSFRVYGGILPNTTKDDALKALEEKAVEVLPIDYSIDYAGESRQLRTEGNTLIGVLGMAIIFVFFVLAIQFNSFRDPLVILLGSVPLAIFSALIITFVDLTTINIYSQVGLITLAGLIAKNAILIVEFANQQQLMGFNKLDAIVKASETRLRPVLMTTLATVLGHFPLVLVSGAGAAARNSIGFVLVFGMLIGTLFTLVILPSIYMALAQEHNANEEQFEAP